MTILQKFLQLLPARVTKLVCKRNESFMFEKLNKKSFQHFHHRAKKIPKEILKIYFYCYFTTSIDGKFFFFARDNCAVESYVGAFTVSACVKFVEKNWEKNEIFSYIESLFSHFYFFLFLWGRFLHCDCILVLSDACVCDAGEPHYVVIRNIKRDFS